MVNLEKHWQLELDRKMQDGYKLVDVGNSVSAAKVWWDLWGMIQSTMETQHIEWIEDMDNIFRGLQCISNWAVDFETVLSNAGRDDKSFLQKRIDFCTEYIAKSKDKTDYNILSMKRAIAETHFDIGMGKKGESLFKVLIKEDPTNCWNWIGWADQYGLFSQKETKNNDRAIEILQEALAVDDLEDRLDVLDRLEILYTELDMKEELADIQLRIKEYGNRHYRNTNVMTSSVKIIKPVTSSKVGRNDPCICGSGKKSKKCCG